MSNQPKFKYALLFGDFVILTAAYWFPLNAVLPGEFTTWSSEPRIAIEAIAIYVFSMPVFLFMYLVHDLYKRQTFRSRYHHLIVLLRSVLISAAIVLPVIVVFGWGFFSLHGRDFLAGFFITTVGAGFILRLGILKLFLYPGSGERRKRRLLIIGGDSAAEKVVTAIERERQPTFEIVGLLDDYKEKGAPLFDNWTNLGSLEDIPQLLASLATDEILIAIDNAPYSRLVRVVDACLASGRVVRIFSDRLTTLAKRLSAEQYAAGIPVIMLSQLRPNNFSLKIRRTVDIFVSIMTLILLSPLLVAVIAGIKLSSPGPVIFRQTRIGYGGKSFDFYKFRSMHVGSSDGSHQQFVQDFIKGESGDAMTETKLNVFKIKADPRIFPFGQFIRRTSLDEFPQLFNVLKGEMGLVGPRPCLPYEWEAYDEWHKDRLSVVPGCTGLWQVLGRSAVTFEDMVIMDLYYISNYSLLQDARILYKTIPVIFFAKGGY